jgi:metal-responsive CopG/Arc/MetJ family transcriptional regulator
MQLTVRVSDEYAEKLERLTKRMGIKRSDIIRLALKQFLEEDFEKDSQTPFQKISHLLGIAESGWKDLGQHHREHLVQKIKRDS